MTMKKEKKKLYKWIHILIIFWLLWIWWWQNETTKIKVFFLAPNVKLHHQLPLHTLWLVTIITKLYYWCIMCRFLISIDFFSIVNFFSGCQSFKIVLLILICKKKTIQINDWWFSGDTSNIIISLFVCFFSKR